MRKYTIAGALAVTLTVSSAAWAVEPAIRPAITFTNGVYSLPANINAGIFQNFEAGGGAPGTTFNGQPNQTLCPGCTAVNGGGSTVEQGNVPGRGINPDPGNDRFLAVAGNYTVNFGASGVQFFSFVFGTLDTYNSLTLNFLDGTSLQLVGSAIAGIASAPVSGTTYNPQLTGRVSYDTQGRPAISSAVFGSTFAAFEIDDLASAAPEPATWAMMILGFGLAGFQLRYRRRKTQVSFA